MDIFRYVSAAEGTENADRLKRRDKEKKGRKNYSYVFSFSSGVLGGIIY